ncbi:MAG: hypothetical protein IJS09_03890 [Treponema sp.]|nr:hypothetical protein [Treponema sp.]
MYKNEVENMYWGEYDYATDVKVQRREAYEQGVSQGIASPASSTPEAQFRSSRQRYSP